MKTTLPNLPFTNYGQAVLSPGSYSSKQTSQRNYPRTDLTTLRHWTTFPNDIHQIIQSATTRANLSPAPFDIGGMSNAYTRDVETEEKICVHATFELHERVEKVLKKLGVAGSFRKTCAGTSAVVGSPDFIWIMHNSQKFEEHPKLTVEYKAWCEADLIDLPSAFAGTRSNTLHSQQSLESLHQIYGYMTFNNHRFGILTNWQRTLFLRRAETDHGKTLDYFSVELVESPNPQILMLKAWVGMVLLAEDNWFFAPSNPTPAPSQSFGDVTRSTAIDTAEGSHLVNSKYIRRSLDHRLCIFDLSSACQGANESISCIVDAELLQSLDQPGRLPIICKVVDILRYPDAEAMLQSEVLAYASLQHLQGRVIPILHGFYEVWGILHLLALQPVGDAISEYEPIDQVLCEKMEASLGQIHNAGYIHGDVALHNFHMKSGNGDVFLVDLERCQLAENQSDFDYEMDKVADL